MVWQETVWSPTTSGDSRSWRIWSLLRGRLAGGARLGSPSPSNVSSSSIILKALFKGRLSTCSSDRVSFWNCQDWEHVWKLGLQEDPKSTARAFSNETSNKTNSRKRRMTLNPNPNPGLAVLSLLTCSFTVLQLKIGQWYILIFIIRVSGVRGVGGRDYVSALTTLQYVANFAWYAVCSVQKMQSFSNQDWKFSTVASMPYAPTPYWSNAW